MKTNQARPMVMAALFIVGCTSCSTRTADPSVSTEESLGPQTVTFYVAGMNERLKIL